MDPVTLKLAKNYTDEQLEPQRLKVATLDKSLSDFQHTLASVNINQELKPTVSGYGSVSLPKTAANWQVSASVIKGLTVTQLADNGADNNKWQTSGICTKNSNSITVFGLENGTTNYILLPTNLKPNTEYTIFYTVINSNLVSDFRIAGGTIVSSLFSIPKTLGQNRIKITTTSPISKNALRFQTTTNESFSNSISINNVMIVEGDWVDKPLDYISYGTKSTVCAGRIRAKNKNLFDGKLELGKALDGTTGLILSVANRGLSNKIPIQPNQNYILSGCTRAAMCAYDINDNLIQGSLLNSFIVTNPNVSYIRFAINTSETYALAQLEKGIVASSYEPHQRSELYYVAKDGNGNIVELRSLPNGIKDEIRASEGKAIIKNKKYVLQASDIFLSANMSNTSIFATKVFTDNLAWFNNPAQSSVVIGGFPMANYINNSWDNVDNIGKYYTQASQRINFVFPLGTTLAQAQAQVAGVTLTYQLAQEEIIPIEVSGNLNSYPSGTIYVENAVADAGIYTDKFSILQQDLPIKEIEKISKIDFMTGLETVLDVSQAVIASDRLSFTHPNLSKDDITAFNYFYDKEGTEGEMTVEFYDSRYVIADSANGKVYQWKITSTNGVPSISLVEV